MKVSITDFDIVYLSFDEPNAEEKWARLSRICPHAKRVHGVVGFDAAHRACADAATTDRFITVDGDNMILPEFLDYQFDIPSTMEDCVFSWAAINEINGIVYGNGGLKLWTKDFVYNMKSHESATGKDKDKTVEFCWDRRYIQRNEVFSITSPNGSYWQSYRAGYREGVKLPMLAGEMVQPADMLTKCHPYNLGVLYRWLSIGADANYGVWAMLGAADGLIEAYLNGMDVTSINNSKYIREKVQREYDKFQSVCTRHDAGFDVIMDIVDGRLALIHDEFGFDVKAFDPQSSELIKRFDWQYNRLFPKYK